MSKVHRELKFTNHLLNHISDGMHAFNDQYQTKLQIKAQKERTGKWYRTIVILIIVAYVAYLYRIDLKWYWNKLKMRLNPPVVVIPPTVDNPKLLAEPLPKHKPYGEKKAKSSTTEIWWPEKVERHY